MSKASDLTGKRFGRLTVLELAPREQWKLQRGYPVRSWRVVCDCGKVRDKHPTTAQLTWGQVVCCSRPACRIGSQSSTAMTRSCLSQKTIDAVADLRNQGYTYKRCCSELGIHKNTLWRIICRNGLKLRKPVPDLTGLRFGRLQVVCLLPKEEWKVRSQQRCRTYLCRCDCGNICHTIQWDLPCYPGATHKTTSCGCAGRENQQQFARRNSGLPISNKLCFHCGATFAGHPEKKYCSLPCRQRFHARNRRKLIQAAMAALLNNSLSKVPS
jgi:hypothetical protein